MKPIFILVTMASLIGCNSHRIRFESIAVPVGRTAKTVVIAPRLLSQPSHWEYPPEALKNGIQGFVSLRVVIDEQGIPVSANAYNGPQEIRQSAEAFIRACRFSPLTTDNIASTFTTEMKCKFVL
jgi:TonB family protein